MSEQVLEQTMLEQHLARLEDLRRQVDSEISALKETVKLVIAGRAVRAREEEHRGMTPNEFGAEIGISGQTVRMHLDEFKHWKVGRKILIDSAEVARYKRAMELGQPGTF